MAEATEIGAEIPNDAPLTDDAKKQRSLALQRDRQSRYRKRLKAKKQQTASGAGGEAAAAEEEDDAAKDRKRLLATARKRKQRSKERAVKEADVVAVPEALVRTEGVFQHFECIGKVIAPAAAALAPFPHQLPHPHSHRCAPTPVPPTSSAPVPATTMTRSYTTHLLFVSSPFDVVHDGGRHRRRPVSLRYQRVHGS